MTSKPAAVLVADVHYNTTTLPLADAAMRMAINKANELNVPLVVAGDLHDTKAMLRGECIKAMLDTFSTCKKMIYVICGNHDRLNEKSEAHSLEFLNRYVTLVDKPRFGWLGNPKTREGLSVCMLPYYSDVAELKAFLPEIKTVSTIIMHQGVQSANMGHYVQDKTSLPKEAFQDFRVISGHYHSRQDIRCGRPRKGAVGLFSYIGNPYTLNFAEANDPEKGFQILMDDGSLQFIPTRLRKHVIVEMEAWENTLVVPDDWLYNAPTPQDLVWVKVRGSRSELSKVTKTKLSKILSSENFKLDLLPTDAEETTQQVDKLQDTEVLDNLIDSLGETKEQKTRLKGLWREIL